MSVRLDEIDEKIIQLLRRNARMSYIEMGRSLGLSEGAVRRRVKRLVGLGIIKRFTIEVERGQDVKAITLISIDPAIPTPTIAERLSEIQGVESIYEVTGQYDAVAMISAPNVDDLNRCIEEIRKVEGVKNTNTAIILRVLGIPHQGV